MPANKIKKLTFSGAAKVHDQGDDGLADSMRKMAQDAARAVTGAASDMTDNSTGADGGTLEVQAGKSVAAFTESGTDSAPKAAFDTATGKIADAMATIAASLNALNTDLGLDQIVDNTTGSDGSGTIAALDKTLAAANSSLVDVVTGRVVLEVLKVNMARLLGASNRIAVASGDTKMTSSLGQGFDGGAVITLDAVAATGASVDGTSNSTIQDAVVDAELTAIANNIAGLAAFLNAITGVTGRPLQVVAFDA